jgi:hypothetical protein
MGCTERWSMLISIIFSLLNRHCTYLHQFLDWHFLFAWGTGVGIVYTARLHRQLLGHMGHRTRSRCVNHSMQERFKREVFDI